MGVKHILLFQWKTFTIRERPSTHSPFPINCHCTDKKRTLWVLSPQKGKAVGPDQHLLISTTLNHYVCLIHRPLSKQTHTSRVSGSHKPGGPALFVILWLLIKQPNAVQGGGSLSISKNVKETHLLGDHLSEITCLSGLQLTHSVNHLWGQTMWMQ